MKIYILSNQKLVKNTLPSLEPYVTCKRRICYIWSMHGLFEVENEKIYNVTINDQPSIKTLIGAFPATIDKSEFIRENESYQVAPRTYSDYIKIVSHKLTNTSNLEWVFEYKDNVIHNNYFQLPNNVNYESYYNEILTFLQL
jgi:hypothetical protein